MATIDPGASLFDQVASRLRDEVPALKSVGTAADLARLVNAKALPPAHKLPAGFVLLPSDTAAANAAPVGVAISQKVTETVTIVLVTYRPNDPTGADALEELEPLKPQIMDALVGWEPGGAFSVLTHSRRTLTGAGGAGRPVTFLHELKTTWTMRR